ncbi:hypothetical protein WN71_010470 [Streptomyces mangrovisoli]|uniref:N-acetyltransferase domain-containing protein n=1 Tax=Streptomyces mangrovisoli TaxID=1428628 RepID=A0A1J4P020_9ACTN|nr:hypothetical protein WN71_010470 [Streptomyces mangrovisoli]
MTTAPSRGPFDAAQGVREVGCRLEPAAAGRGPATRAVRVLLEWAFDERGLHRVEWGAASADQPSVNVARRPGMTRERVLRERRLHKGVRQDTEVRSLLVPEWRAVREEVAREK